MDAHESRDGRGYDVASGIVVFLGLYQGAVALLVRLLFDRDQRFAPALWLPAPWWWMVCIAIVVIALVLLAVIQEAKQRRFSTVQEGAPSASSPQSEKDDDGTAAYDAALGVVFLIGIYNGVAPFVARLFFDGDLLLAFPLRLRAPWWWITSIAVLVASTILLMLIDQAKQRRHSPD